MINYDNDWRQMYLRRPHLNYDGVYISKASYAREGEKSLDNFYRPWHLVEYYRYLRFLSTGIVLFLTTPDEPKQTVAKLRRPTTTSTNNLSSSLSSLVSHSHSGAMLTNSESILRGNWTLNENKITISLVRKLIRKQNQHHNSRRNNAKELMLEQEHWYKMELELSSTSERKLNNQLGWSLYEITVINKYDHPSYFVVVPHFYLTFSNLKQKKELPIRNRWPNSIWTRSTFRTFTSHASKAIHRTQNYRSGNWMPYCDKQQQ